MNLNKLILTKNNCYKAQKTIVVKGLILHSTGANNPNLKRYVGPDDGKLGVNSSGNHWNQAMPGGNQICCHGFIGKLADGSIATYQTLPWNHRGWHCGVGKNGSGNNTHIGIEVCEGTLTDKTYFNAVYREAAELFAYLCKQYGLNPTADGVIIDHAEGYKRGVASNHSDITHWFKKHGKTMDDFRKAVKAAMGASVAVKAPTSNNVITLRLNAKKAIVNGKVGPIDENGSCPYVLNGKTMVPLRFTSEKMGATVKWTANNKPVTIKYGSTTVELTVGSKTMTVARNGKDAKATLGQVSVLKNDQAPVLKNGRIYVPLRAVAESLGFSVKYDDGTKIIVITKGKLSAVDLAAMVKDGAGRLK